MLENRYFPVIFLFISAFHALRVSSNQERVTLLFVGDISFAAVTKYYVEHGYCTYNDSFKDVATYIREADVSIGNLESPFVGKNVYPHIYKGRKFVILDASPSAASALSFAGFDAVSIANNHMNDFSSEGVDFTVETLKKTGIKPFGNSYGGWSSSQKPLIMEVKGTKIGFLGYCDSPAMDKNCTEMRMLFKSGPAIYTDDIARRDVKSLREAEVDIIVVVIHFGEELYSQPLPYQRRISRHLISLGVQIIIGAHPHVLQPHCLHNNTLVAYSLGNFLFHPRRPPDGTALFQQGTYGRLGKKPNKKIIEAFEHFVLGNCEDLKISQMLKVTITRGRLLEAEYLPVKIKFDKEKKLLHPEPSRNAEWIKVCSKGDRQCQRDCKTNDDEMRHNTKK
ncbi:capsule biosynthesis protein CapA-like isoform X1 [Montipora foliosa]|uniref:capsule biosynthesis protein CapA-like isoform X1 n=1 Tax=Montipora foliosa TaxID=591990 RepID=UPI0035F13298